MAIRPITLKPNSADRQDDGSYLWGYVCPHCAADLARNLDRRHPLTVTCQAPVEDEDGDIAPCGALCEIPALPAKDAPAEEVAA